MGDVEGRLRRHIPGAMLTTDVIVGFRNAYEADTQTLEQKVEALERFAEAVIAKVS